MIRPADRLLSILLLEVGILLFFLSLAESALGARIPPDWIAAMMIIGWIGAPIATLLPAFAAHPQRLMRGTGIVVFACGVVSILIRSHETSDLTLLMLGCALFTHVCRVHDPGVSGEAPGDPGPIASCAEGAACR